MGLFVTYQVGMSTQMLGGQKIMSKDDDDDDDDDEMTKFLIYSSLESLSSIYTVDV
jgi:hypothetical protein